MVTDKEYAEVLDLTEEDHQRIKDGLAGGYFDGAPGAALANYRNATGEKREGLDRQIAYRFDLKTEEDKRTEAVSESAKSAADSAEAAKQSARAAADALREIRSHRRAAWWTVVFVAVSALAAVVSVSAAIVSLGR